MERRNLYLLVFVLILFGFALSIVLPVDSGALGNKNFQLGLDLKGGSFLLYEADLSKKDPSQTDSQVMAAVLEKIQRRVNSYGVMEPLIQIQGNKNILVHYLDKGIVGIEFAGDLDLKIFRLELVTFPDIDTH